LFDLRARSQLVAAAASKGRERARLVRGAERDGLRLERERAAWSGPLACLVGAGCAALRGDRASACSFLEAAVECADQADMALHAAVARYWLGRLRADETGRLLQAQGEQWLASEGVVAVERYATLLAPGVAGIRA